MFSKVAVPVAGAGLALTGGFKVHAASMDKQPATMKKYELSIYPTESQKVQDYFFYEEELSPFREQIRKARTAIWKNMDKIQGTTGNAKQSFQSAKEKTNNYFRYIQEDAGLLHKACIITVCGLGGVVAGYRGGTVKKAFLSLSGMTAAAALCYPYQAVELADSAYIFTKETVVNAVWKPESNVTDRRTTKEKVARQRSIPTLAYDCENVEEEAYECKHRGELECESDDNEVDFTEFIPQNLPESLPLYDPPKCPPGCVPDPTFKETDLDFPCPPCPPEWEKQENIECEPEKGECDPEKIESVPEIIIEEKEQESEKTESVPEIIIEEKEKESECEDDKKNDCIDGKEDEEKDVTEDEDEDECDDEVEDELEDEIEDELEDECLSSKEREHVLQKEESEPECLPEKEKVLEAEIKAEECSKASQGVAVENEPAKVEETKSEKSEDTKSEPVEVKEEECTCENKDTETSDKKTENKEAGDFGMSKKEDQDMYTTRQ